MPNWLDILIHSTSELESPERFMYWAGLCAISAVMKKSVYINRFSYKLYPNLYVILVSAKSGLRKGLPVEYAKTLVEKVGNTRVISGRNSVQGVLKTLAQQKTLENGTILHEAQGFLCAPELKSFMIGDDQALDILTDLHSTHEHEKEWNNTLRNSPIENLKSPCITLLGAANETMFDALINQKDLEGGFIGRTFVVYESNRRVINSLMWEPKNLITKDILAVYLKEISQQKGEFLIDEKVRIVYDKWYKKIAQLTGDRTGTLERIGDQCLRVAMLISLADSPDLVITKENMETAIFRSEEFFAGTKRISMGNGRADTAYGAKLVIKHLLLAKGNELERSRILSKMFPDVDYMMFDKVVDTLGSINGSGILEAYRNQEKKVMYKLKAEFVENYKTFQQEEKE